MVEAPEPSVRALGWRPLAFASVSAAALAGAVFAGDGSGMRGVLPAGGLALVLLAAAVVVVAAGRMPAPRLGASGAALVAALLALVVWTGATIAWSIAGDLSWDALAKGLAFAAFLGLGIVAAGMLGGFAARTAATMLASIVAAALVWALLGKAIPALDPDGSRIARLNEPVDYWNALALLADVGIVLGLWLAAGRRHLLATRLAGGLLVYVATLALALTLSRVGVVAALVVVALWLALSSERVEGGLLLLASAGPAVVVAGWAFTRPALVESGATEPDRAADGRIFGALALIGALLVLLTLAAGLRRELGERGRQRARRGLVASAALVAVAVTAVVGVAIGDVVTSGRSCAEVENVPGRLGSLDPNSRWCWWNEAWDVFAQHAPHGAGAGTFEIARKRHRLDARSVRQPHSVPLQQLAGGGIIALALFIAVVVSGAAVCGSALRRLRGPERAAAAALVAAPAAYLVHALVDYDWDFLATTGPVMFSLGVLAVAGRARGRARRRMMLGVLTVLLALAVLGSFTAPRLAERSVRASTRALVAGEYDRARDQALWARFWNPVSVDPIYALARIDERRGRVDAAERRYVQAVELQPDNPETWYALGLFELQVRRNLCAAYRFLNEAYTLDPVGSQWVPGGELDQARDAVDEGACG